MTMRKRRVHVYPGLVQARHGQSFGSLSLEVILVTLEI